MTRWTRREGTQFRIGLARLVATVLVVGVGVGVGACTRAETPTSPPDARIAASPATDKYGRRPPSRGGTGKVFMDREIAQTLSVHGIPWLERSERDEEEAPDRLIAALELADDDVVADVGAGSGYFSRRLARAVPRGRVLAVDIQQGMLDALIEDAERRGIANIEPVLGAVDDPKLPEEVVDLALLVDAYHEFTHPLEMMRGVLRSLVPGGRLVLVEYRGEDESSPIHPLHKMTEEQVRREMAVITTPDGARLEHVETLDVLPGQHILIFRRVDGETE